MAADDDAIGIGIQPVARTHPLAVDAHHHIALAFATALCGHGHQAQGTDAYRRGLQFGHIAHAAIHHQACPAVVRRCRCQIAAHQSPAQRTRTIHHQHPPLPGRLHRRLYLGVVFVALHRGDLAGKRGHAAVAVPGRSQHAKLAAGIVFMGIAKIAGTESGRGHSSHGKSWEINTGATPRAAGGPTPMQHPGLDARGRLSRARAGGLLAPCLHATQSAKKAPPLLGKGVFSQ